MPSLFDGTLMSANPNSIAGRGLNLVWRRNLLKAEKNRMDGKFLSSKVNYQQGILHDSRGKLRSRSIHRNQDDFGSVRHPWRIAAMAIA